MKYVYTFSEISHGRIEVISDHEPDNGEIMDKILEGMAYYHNTDFTDFRLIEVDGVAQAECAEGAWESYLRYLRDWADSHSTPAFYGMTPACFDEWCDNEDQEVDK